MKKIIYLMIFFFVGILCLLFSNLTEIRDEHFQRSAKNEKILEDKALEQDTEAIKQFLVKVLESQIKEENFINKHFIKKTLQQMSKQLAVYYNHIINFADYPDRSIKMINDIIDNSQGYVEAGSMYLQQKKRDLLKRYNIIKDKYCTNFLERLLRLDNWKEKTTIRELEKIKTIESDIAQIDNILAVFNRVKVLFTMIDWTIYSHSPLAWVARKYLGI